MSESFAQRVFNDVANNTIMMTDYEDEPFDSVINAIFRRYLPWFRANIRYFDNMSARITYRSNYATVRNCLDYLSVLFDLNYTVNEDGVVTFSKEPQP